MRHALDAFLASLAGGLTTELVAHIAERATVAGSRQRHAAGHDCETENYGLPCGRAKR